MEMLHKWPCSMTSSTGKISYNHRNHSNPSMSQVMKMKMKSRVRPHEAARGHRLLRWAWKKFCRGRHLHECRGNLDRTHLHATGGTKTETLYVEQYTIWMATNSLRGLFCQRFVGECLSQNKNGMQTSLKKRKACPRLFNTRSMCCEVNVVRWRHVNVYFTSSSATNCHQVGLESGCLPETRALAPRLCLEPFAKTIRTRLCASLPSKPFAKVVRSAGSRFF